MTARVAQPAIEALRSVASEESYVTELVSAAEAAARLGVKRQTIYAYVSRGVLHRTVSTDGRTSLFDPAEIDALKLGRVDRTEGELRAVIATGLTRVDDDGLLIRGQSVVDLIATPNGFVDLVECLWDSPEGEPWPAAEGSTTGCADALDGIDALRALVAEASSNDALRHDLSPAAVRAVGRRIITAMVHGLATQRDGSDATIARALWRRLTARRGNQAEWRTLDVALALLVDHGLAASTFAARIAASVRADPYSVVSAGLGVLGGQLHGAASAGVHELIAQAAKNDDATGAVADVLRIQGRLPGFGHTVYARQDPRYHALMAVVVSAWADDPRLRHVYRVRDVVAERRSAIPNVDLALGALTWLSGMKPDAGEVIFAVARTAGWLAHATEEYGEQAGRFRPRARYTGPR